MPIAVLESDRLGGDIAFVTGGARGIGRHIALRLARAGAAVAVGCRTNRPAAEAVVAEIKSLGGRGLVVAGDLAEVRSAESMVDEIERGLGPVTVLVHNAAPPRKGALLLQDDWDQFDLHYRVGVQAAWALSRRIVPGMRARGSGRIILVTTTSTSLYVPGFGAYCSAKAAMETFARYLAVELGRAAITVNVVAPGLTQKDETPMPNDRPPLGRNAHAREVAEAVAMFADPAMQGLTGTVLAIDAGLRLLEPARGQAPA